MAVPDVPAVEDVAAVEVINNILNEAEDAEVGQVILVTSPYLTLPYIKSIILIQLLIRRMTTPFLMTAFLSSSTMTTSLCVGSTLPPGVYCTWYFSTVV